eukprot:GHVU01004920.1.p1 GENE.GHVU01004920.1~~GHVU01004920.1.p1  ORF type:complete len:323 (-),score=36.74 GHVU01004920.1:918-1886(-)
MAALFLLWVDLQKTSYDNCRWACQRFECRGYSNLGVKVMGAAIAQQLEKTRLSAAAYHADGVVLLGDGNELEDEDAPAGVSEDDDDAQGRGRPGGGVQGQQATRSEATSYRKASTNSIFRAINVSFHDTLVGRLGSLGDLATRDQLDRHHAGSPHPFFVDAAALFNDVSVQELDKLQYEHKLFVRAHLDPSCFERMDAKSLKGVWGRVSRVYRDVHRMFTKSGNHEEFSNFSRGRQDILYLHMFLMSRPNITSMVQARLPEEAALESTEVGDRMGSFMARTVAAASAKAAAARASAVAERSGKRKGEVSGLTPLLEEVTKVL